MLTLLSPTLAALTVTWEAFVLLFAYGLAGALMMAIALGILIKIWDLLTPIDEWEELRKGNMAVAVVLAAVILGFAAVVCTAIMPS